MSPPVLLAEVVGTARDDEEPGVVTGLCCHDGDPGGEFVRVVPNQPVVLREEVLVRGFNGSFLCGKKKEID